MSGPKGDVNCTMPSPSQPQDVPGTPLSTTSVLMGGAASVVQSFKPLKNVAQHFCGFAFYANDPSRQVELHHFCSQLNDDFAQCAVYDSLGVGARLIGIEYVISFKLFETLDEEEKKLWHSHPYDIKSGSMMVPEVPFVQEKAMINNFIETYGKTYLLWQFDRGDVLPLGKPELMMVATKDGHWNPELFENRKKAGVDQDGIWKNREENPLPPTNPQADSWLHGRN